MPQAYQVKAPTIPEEEELKGKDLGFALDIGGSVTVKDLTPAERLSKDLGNPYQETKSTGIALDTKIPIISDAIKIVGDSPVGYTFGKLFEVLNLPSYVVQNIYARIRMNILNSNDLPSEVRDMKLAGRSDDEIADYLVNSNMAFTNDATQNLVFTLLLDPLNFTPAVFGKVGALKPLSAVAGGIAGGALGGAVVAGPVGMLGGAAAGAYGVYKAGRAAAKASTLAREAEAVGTGTMSAGQKLIMSLEKQRGLDVTARVSQGSSMLETISTQKKIISAAEKEIEAIRASSVNTAKNTGRLQDLQAEISRASGVISTAEGAISKGAITDRTMVGLYNGLVKSKNAASSGLSGFGAAMMVPAKQLLGLEYGGHTANETISTASEIYGEKAGDVAELIGEGMADPIHIAIGKSLVRPEESAAKMFAANTAQLFWKAKESLRAREVSGVIVEETADNIAGEILTLTQEMPGGAIKILDTADARIIKKRVEILSQVTDIERSSGGRASNAALARLESSIAQDYTLSKIEAMVRGGGVEKVLAETLRKMGSRKIYESGAEELRAVQLELIPKISDKVSARELYRQYQDSISAAIGVETTRPGYRAAVDSAFESTFAKFYDKSGKLADERKAKMAAQQMSIFTGGSFTSANRAAGRINEAVRNLKALANPVGDAQQAEKARIVELVGEEGLNDLIGYAEKIGDIQLVKRGYLFHSSVDAAVDVFSFIARISDNASASMEGNVPVNVRQELGQPLVTEYIGKAEDVISVRMKVMEIRRKAQANKDTAVIDFTGDLLKELRGKTNLAQVKRAWATTATKHFDDVRSQFHEGSSPDSINSMLTEALLNRSTLYGLTDLEAAKYKILAKISGVDPIILDKFKQLQYRPVRAPTRGAIRNSRVIQNPDALDSSMKLTTDVRVSPYIDLNSPYLKEYSVMERYSANKLQEFMTAVFSPIGSSTVSGSVKRRLITNLSRGGVSTAQAQRILDGLVTEAMREGIGARGLLPDVIESVFKSSFDVTGGAGAYDRFKESWRLSSLDGKSEFKAVDAVMRAFQGDLAVVGGTQYLTGAMKRSMPWTAQITDRMYPNYRFKSNPLYWVQEYLESGTLNSARGADAERLSLISQRTGLLQATAGEVRDLAMVGPETHVIVDNINFVSVFREDAMKRALSGDWREPVDLGFKATMGRAARGEQGAALADVKEANKDILALDIVSKQFSDTIRKDDPVLWAALVEHYGTRDSRELFLNFINHRKKLGTYDRVMSDIEASRPAAFGWMTIPDNRVNGRSEVLAEELDRLFGSFTGLRNDTVKVWRANPQELADSISMSRSNLADAGYDITMFDEEFHALKQEARALASLKVKDPAAYAKAISTTDSPEMARLSESVLNARKSMDRLLEAKMKATYRYRAAKYVLMESGYRQGADLSYEGDRIAQALALGHSYGSELGDVSSTLQRIVDKVASGYPDAYKNVRTLTSKSDDVTGVLSPEELGSVLERGSAPVYSRKFEEEIRAAVMEEISSNPSLLDSIDSASYRLVTDHGAEERVYRAFQTSYATAMETANKVAYFDSNRSFFERTVNHPFLGFYPYSYMFKKILPETMQFLFKTPFGAAAPGAGYQAYMHVRDYVENKIETDYYFKKTLEDNDQVAFMISQLFPGVPWDIAALPPSWTRAIARSTVGGGDKQYDPFTDFLGRDVLGKATNFGPVTAGIGTLNASQQLLTELTGGNKPKPATPPDSGGLPDFNIGG